MCDKVYDILDPEEFVHVVLTKKNGNPQKTTIKRPQNKIHQLFYKLVRNQPSCKKVNQSDPRYATASIKGIMMNISSGYRWRALPTTTFIS
jgi:hypothetical protein